MGGSQQMKTTWLMGALILCLVAAITFGEMSSASARDAANIATGERDEANRQRRVAEASLQNLVEVHTALEDTVTLLHRAVVEASALARSERRRASALSDTLVSHVEAVAGDSASVVALVDSIVTAHGEEIHALEVQLGVVLTENEWLWKLNETADSVTDAALEANALLHIELAAANERGDQWQKAAQRSSLIKWGERAAFAVVLIVSR